MKYPNPKLVIGDKVAYSVQFLRSIGMSHSDMAHGRGIVTEIKNYSDTLNTEDVMKTDLELAVTDCIEYDVNDSAFGVGETSIDDDNRIRRRVEKYFPSLDANAVIEAVNAELRN